MEKHHIPNINANLYKLSSRFKIRTNEFKIFLMWLICCIIINMQTFNGEFSNRKIKFTSLNNYE
jgi:hypothetical protein